MCETCQRLKLACVYPAPGTERKNKKRKALARRLKSDEVDEREPRAKSQRLSLESPRALLGDLVGLEPPELEGGHAQFTLAPRRAKQQSSSSSSSSSSSYDSPGRDADHHDHDNDHDHLDHKNEHEHIEQLEFDHTQDSRHTNSLEMRATDSLRITPVDEPDSTNDNTTTNNNDVLELSPRLDLWPGSTPTLNDTTSGSCMDEFLIPLMDAPLGFDILLPQPAAASPWHALKLDSDGQRLFEYFCTRQAPLMSVSPHNQWLEEFVPMAAQCDAVLYALVAWAGFHKSAGQDPQLAYSYLNKAMQQVVSNFAKAGVTTLATLLLICAAEICSGDVVHWNKHLSLAAKVINMNGGLASFVSTKSLQWLASNFAYHDLLAASTCARNTHFKPTEYEALMRRGSAGGSPDSLIGCCQSLFQLLAEVSDLAVEVHGVYANHSLDADARLESLRVVRLRAQLLERKIEQCTPNHLSILTLSQQDVERQLEMFECFQLAAKVHLYQSVLRMNSGSVSMQIAGRHLLRRVDSMLGSPVEGSIIFPLFLAGLCCCSDEERDRMRTRFAGYQERNLAQNISRTMNLLEEVWKRDDQGAKHVHWYSIIESRGWDICFA